MIDDVTKVPVDLGLIDRRHFGAEETKSIRNALVHP